MGEVYLGIYVFIMLLIVILKYYFDYSDEKYRKENEEEYEKYISKIKACNLYIRKESVIIKQ